MTKCHDYKVQKSSSRSGKHLQKTNEAFERLPEKGTSMLHSTGQGLIEMGSEPRDQESILVYQKKENETGNNENTIDTNKDADKHTQQRIPEETVSQLWHYKLQAPMKLLLCL